MALSSRPCVVVLVASVVLVALVVVVVFVASVASPARGWDRDTPTKVLSVLNGGPWGEWGFAEFCPGGAFATGLQVKIEPFKDFGGTTRDSTGCGSSAKGGAEITSSVGPCGEWSEVATCPAGSHLVSFQLNAEAPRGAWDDTAADDLQGLCSEGSPLSAWSNPRGEWGGWSQSCPAAWGVCGLRTRVDHSQEDIDDTGLNDVQFICCPPRPPPRPRPPDPPKTTPRDPPGPPQ